MFQYVEFLSEIPIFFKHILLNSTCAWKTQISQLATGNWTNGVHFLKEEIKERFNAQAKAMGEPDLLDKIADETVATTEAEVLDYITKKDHPALKMDSLF